ncbi:hypothetical protein DVH24_033182 [Malus domestica]|uniref:Uncharacterized protein n=1 Tax=Malus domestica TaxID=3750 RepID=A0A498JAX7_MALDO|nr:hypothetical protein DVH24_033182 [Malus domestica]
MATGHMSPPIPFHYDWRALPFRFPQLTDYQSLKKNVAGASSASSAIRAAVETLKMNFQMLLASTIHHLWVLAMVSSA